MKLHNHRSDGAILLYIICIQEQAFLLLVLWISSGGTQVPRAHGRIVQLGQLSLSRQQQSSEIHESWSANLKHHCEQFESLKLDCFVREFIFLLAKHR